MTTVDKSTVAAVGEQMAVDKSESKMGGIATETIGIINPLELVGIAWEGVVRNKVRSLLTMLGIIIGVAAVIIMIAISAGTEAQIAEQIQGLGANLAFIQSSASRAALGNSNTPRLTYDDTAVIASVNGVVGTSVEQPATQTVKADGTTLTDVSIVGTTEDFPSVRALELANGRFFNEQELERTAKVAVLGATLAQDLFGDADPVGQSITVGTTRLTVIGVAAERGVVGNTDFDAQLYAPITLVFDKFVPSQFAQIVGNSVRLVYAQIDDEADMADVLLQIELKLAGSMGIPVDEVPVTIQTQQDIVETQSATTAAFRNLLAWVAGVSLLVGGIGIMNIMLVSVTERTREIGIPQSLGATPNDIRLQFLIESLMLSLVGGLIGVGIGVGGGVLFGQTGDMPTVIVPSSILLAFGSSAAIGVFFGYFPANKAAQLDPIDALRHE